MTNRFLLLGAGALLAVGLGAFNYMRESDMIGGGKETVIALDPDRNAALVALLEGPTPSEGTVFYGCPDGRAFAVVHNAEDSSAAITLDGGTRQLSFVPVPEGRQYTDGELVLFTQGAVAAVLVGETVAHQNCRLVEAAAVPDGPAGGS